MSIEENVQHDDVRDLVTPADNTEPSVEIRQREPDTRDPSEERKPEIQYGSRADRKRQEIAERAKEAQSRGPGIERSDEDERMLGGLNLETRADRERADTDQRRPAEEITADDIPTPNRRRLKVNGRDVEVDEDQITQYAQIALASQDILNEAKAAKTAAQQELAELQRLRADHSRTVQEQPAQEVVQAKDTKPATDDELDAIVDRLQTGEIKDARAALAKYGEDLITRAEQRIFDRIGDIDQRIVATTRQTEEENRILADSERTVSAFITENNDFMENERRQVVLFDTTVEIMRDNLYALGVQPQTIEAIARKDGLAITAAIGRAYRMLGQKGYDLPKHNVILKEAADKVRKDFGMPSPRLEETPPADKGKNSDFVAERTERKQAMQHQPRRANVAPGTDLGPAKSREDKNRDYVRQLKVYRRGR